MKGQCENMISILLFAQWIDSSVGSGILLRVSGLTAVITVSGAGKWMRESQDLGIIPFNLLLFKTDLSISSDEELTTIQGSSSLIQTALIVGIFFF